MPSNKLRLASERRKLALRAQVLNNRQRIAQLQEQTKRARDELATFKKSRSAAPAGGIPTVRIR